MLWHCSYSLWDIMVDTCHYIFVQIPRMHNMKNNLNVNYGLWMTMMCPCRLIDCNECTTLVQDVVHMWEQRVYHNCLVLNTAVDLTLISKIKSAKKEKAHITL